MRCRTVVVVVALALLASSCSIAPSVRRPSAIDPHHPTGTAAPLVRDDRLKLPGEPYGLAVDRQGYVETEDLREVVSFDRGKRHWWSAPVAGASTSWPWLGHGLVVVPTLGARDLDRTAKLRDQLVRDGAGPGGCVALDRATGEDRWSYEEEGRSGVAVSGLGDRVYCLFGDATIVAVDADTGERVWRAQVRTDTSSDVIDEWDRTAIVADAASQTLAFGVRINDQWFLDVRDLETGADLKGWRLSSTEPSSPPVAVGAGRVFIASGGQQACVFDLVRKVAAACVDGIPVVDGFELANVPVLAPDGLVIAVAREGVVVAIDIERMKVWWTKNLGVPFLNARPVVTGGDVVVADYSSRAWALRLSDGAKVPVPAVDGAITATAADPLGGVALAVVNEAGAGRIEHWRPSA